VQPLALPAYAQTHAWHLFILRIDSERCGIDREAFMKGLQDQGIGTGIHFIATHLHTWYRQRDPDLYLPDTEWNSARLCSIPLFPDMSDQDLDRVVGAIATLMDKRP
jgi:UDP-4-amino-4-deoxy-L-arabinose-oxoglutarate aminotransferase